MRRFIDIAFSSVLGLGLVACGGSSSASTTTTSAASAGGEATQTDSRATLRIGSDAAARNFSGGVSVEFAELVTWNPDLGQLNAYFGQADGAFGLTLNLQEAFSVGSRSVSTGPVVISLGATFEQRVDIQASTLAITAFDLAERRISLRLEGTTYASDGAASAPYVLEASVRVPAAAN